MAGNHPSSAVFFLGPRQWLLLAIILLFQFQYSESQQSYVNNKQLQCEQNYTTTLGYVCTNNTRNVPGAATSPSSCASYVTFRSTPVYNSPATIGYLLDADPSEIARLNNISDVGTIPANTLIIVPVNCSCSSAPDGLFYQHTASYVLKFTGETYFSVANNTYQGLSTCQSMIGQNLYNYRHLLADMKLNVPLRCACPSPNQTANGIKYLLTYLIIWGDTINDIAAKFDSGGTDNQSIFYANKISSDGLIFPFTPLLVPLKTEPTKTDLSATPPPPPPSPPALPTTPVTDDDNNSSRKWVFVGVGIGAGLLLLASMSGCLVWFFRRRSLIEGKQTTSLVPNRYGDHHKPIVPVNNQSSSWSVSSEGVRYAIGSLTLYKFEELQQATGFFGESNRIRGSVYRGSFKGDAAAVKIMKGDVSTEINILKQINHSNIIRLSGYCVHQGNTYLVYEYAEQGSVSNLLHDLSSMKDLMSNSTVVGWNQRVQIAYDVADALNYLHNYTNPPYIHKNLTSSNVLLDGNLRAKIANFGLARTLLENDQDCGMQLTRHVVGTYGCMAPEYIENGLITPKMDVFAFGVLMLELLSGREAVQHEDIEKEKEDELLYVKIIEVLGGENVREKLREFMDPCLRDEYPLDLAYSMAQLARSCVADDLNSRPNISEVFMTLSKIHSSSLDWDPSDELDYSRSMSHGR